MQADLEYHNDPEQTRQTRRDWIPGVLALIASDPKFVLTAVNAGWQTLSKYLRGR